MYSASDSTSTRRLKQKPPTGGAELGSGGEINEEIPGVIQRLQNGGGVMECAAEILAGDPAEDEDGDGRFAEQESQTSDDQHGSQCVLSFRP